MNIEDATRMILTKYITKTCVVPDMQATNKHDALSELTHHLFDKKKLSSDGLALDQIMAREMTESTGIGRGIAVPHARVPGLKSLICAVGRIPEGLDFLSVDRKPVHLIFLVCYPPTQQTTYLNFIATVSRLLRKKEQLDAMLKAESADEMYDTLERLSQALVPEHEVSRRRLEADPKIEQMADGHSDLILLARLQLCEEMLDAARIGKTQIKQRIENIRSLVEPRILRHYDRLSKSRRPGLVPVEGDTCQGCFMKLPSQFVQQVRQDPDHMHTCISCSRYIYVV